MSSLFVRSGPFGAPQRFNVLVVDPDRFVLRALERSIVRRRPSWRIGTALDGDEALVVLSRRRVDAVIVALELPRGEVSDVLRAARAVRRDMVCVVHGGRGPGVHAASELADGLLPRPSPAHALIGAVEAVRRIDEIRATA